MGGMGGEMQVREGGGGRVAEGRGYGGDVRRAGTILIRSFPTKMDTSNTMATTRGSAPPRRLGGGVRDGWGGVGRCGWEAGGGGADGRRVGGEGRGGNSKPSYIDKTVGVKQLHPLGI